MNGLGDGLGDAGAVCVTVGDGDGDGDGDADALGEGLALGEALAVVLAEADAVGEVVPAGENEDEDAEGVPAEQAETAAEARMVMVLQPMTANLALCLAAAPVERTFMAPPRTSPLVAAPSRSRHQEPAPGKSAPPAARTRRKQLPGNGDGHKGKARGQRGQPMT